MTDDILQNRYRALLRAYPAKYRTERADELLEIVLAEAEPGRRRPDTRQAIALVRGGLRVRSGSTTARPGLTLLWQGLQLAAVAVLALGVLIGVDDLIEAFQFGGLSNPTVVLLEHGPLLLANIAAATAALLGRRWLAVGFAVAAVVVQPAVSSFLADNMMPQWLAPIVALPLLLAGLRRPADVPALDRGNAVLVTAGVLALHAVPFLPVTVLVGAVFLWVATADQRLLIAAAPTFVLEPLYRSVTADQPFVMIWPSLAVAGVLLVVAAVSAGGRRARA